MPQKPFFRKHDGWWVVQLRQGAKRWQHKLIKGARPRGKDTEQQAFTLFNNRMADGADSLPPPTKIRMAEVLKAFLEHSASAHKPSTFEWYKNFLVSFDDLFGTLRPHQVTPDIIEAWLKTEKGWKACRRGAIMTIKCAMKWALDNKKITTNPIQGLKVPPANAASGS